MNRKISHNAIVVDTTVYTTLKNKFEKINSLTVKISRSLDTLHEIITEQYICYRDFQMLLKASSALSQNINSFLESGNEELESAECMILRHDMRTHVGGIMGYAELSLEDMDENIDELFKAQFRNIYEICEEILPLVNTIRPYFELGPQEIGNIASQTYLQASEETASYSGKYSDCKVVVIDDSVFTRDILTRRLEAMGINVTAYESGVEGLEYVRTNGADLVLLDVVIPDISGLEILKQLKNDPKTEDIAIIMVSSLSEVQTIVNCIDAGAEDYLPSPFNPSILKARVAASLDKKLMTDRQNKWIDEVSRHKRTLQTAIESMEECFAMFSENGNIIICNNHFQDLYPYARKMNGCGFTLEELLRENYAMGVYFVERRSSAQDTPVDSFETWLEKRLKSHMNYEVYEERLCDGRWFEITTQDTPDGSFVTIHKNVTQRHKDQEKMQFLAHHDPLTGLLNRLSFSTALHAFTEKAEAENSLLAVLFLDLDGFKQVNDELGHEAGDIVLTHVAEKLKSVVREEDPIARLGGDEFAIILFNLESLDNVETIADRIITEVGTSINIDGSSANFGVSVGGALYSKGLNSPEQLLKLADEAMYDVKKSGKGAYKIAASK